MSQFDFITTIEEKQGIRKGTILTFYPPIDIKLESLLRENEFHWIPNMWAVCNGLNNTPDLIEFFILNSDDEENNLDQQPKVIESFCRKSQSNGCNMINEYIRMLLKRVKLIYIVRK